MIAGKRTQCGFGFIEIALTLAIVGILGTGITAFAVQTITETNRSKDHMQEIQQMENAGFWMNHDIQVAQEVATGPDAGFPLTANWTDVNQNTFSVTFSINGTQLQRTLIENSDLPRLMILLESLNPSPEFTSCSYADNILTFNVTTTIRNWDLSRTFTIKKRPWQR